MSSKSPSSNRPRLRPHRRRHQRRERPADLSRRRWTVGRQSHRGRLYPGSLGAQSGTGVAVLLRAPRRGAKAQPNPAHYALAELEKRIGDRFFLCTQNVDDLHERAGSVRLVHMHGELARLAASATAASLPSKTTPSTPTSRRSAVALAEAGSGRTLSSSARFRSKWIASSEEIAKSTLMVVVGTSGSVYPAAGFVHWARQRGARTVYVGPEPPLNASAFTQVVEGNAGQVLPGLFTR